MAAPVAPFKVKRTKTLLNLCSLVLLGLGIAMVVLLGNLLGLLPLATGVCGVLGLSFAWYRGLVLFTLIAWGTLVLCGIEIAMLVAHPDNVFGWLIWISCSLFALPAAVLSSTLHLLAGAPHRRLCPHPCPRTRTRPCPRAVWKPQPMVTEHTAPLVDPEAQGVAPTMATPRPVADALPGTAPSRPVWPPPPPMSQAPAPSRRPNRPAAPADASPAPAERQPVHARRPRLDRARRLRRQQRRRLQPATGRPRPRGHRRRGGSERVAAEQMTRCGRTE